MNAVKMWFARTAADSVVKTVERDTSGSGLVRFSTTTAQRVGVPMSNERFEAILASQFERLDGVFRLLR